MQAKIKILRSNAKLPKRAYPDDAGMDFYYCADDDAQIIIHPMGNAVIPTGVSIEVPKGYMLEMKNKSGVAAKRQLLVGSCVIDRGYTGEIFVNLNNVGTDAQIIEPGQKLAQGVFVKIAQPELIIIETDQDLYEKSDRQEGSLGSTGDF